MKERLEKEVAKSEAKLPEQVEAMFKEGLKEIKA